MNQVLQNFLTPFSNLVSMIYGNIGQYIPKGVATALIVASIIGLIIGVYYFTTNRPSDKLQKNTISLDFSDVFTVISNQRRGLNTYLEEKLVQESQSNWVLFNFAPLTLSHAGYMAEKGKAGVDGQFHTDAIRNCLNMGFRCFVFDVDMYEGSQKDTVENFVAPGEPCLLYRDNQGVIRSRNCGRIEQMMTALAEQAFSPSLNTGNDPLIVILKFITTPDPAKNKGEYMSFLKKVSQQIQPLSRTFLDRIGTTRFSMGENSDLLFTQNFQALRGRTLIFSNINTDMFINPSQTIPIDKNLRSWINSQMYSLSSDLIPKDSVTEVTPKGKQMSVGIQNGDYFLNTPPDKVKEAQLKTNNVYTVLNPPEAFTNYKLPDIQNLMIQYGVQMLMFNPYITPEETDAFFKWWGPYSWKLKPKEIQYVVVRALPPKPVSVRANANGGNVNPPALRF